MKSAPSEPKPNSYWSKCLPVWRAQWASTLASPNWLFWSSILASSVATAAVRGGGGGNTQWCDLAPHQACIVHGPASPTTKSIKSLAVPVDSGRDNLSAGRELVGGAVRVPRGVSARRAPMAPSPSELSTLKTLKRHTPSLTSLDQPSLTSFAPPARRSQLSWRSSLGAQPAQLVQLPCTTAVQSSGAHTAKLWQLPCAVLTQSFGRTQQAGAAPAGRSQLSWRSSPAPPRCSPLGRTQQAVAAPLRRPDAVLQGSPS